MIRAYDAIQTARALLGTPYCEMDCIRLIVMVIRRSSGGRPDYRCEGTNWLWQSMDNASKYRHLTWRQSGTHGAKAGMLAFKQDGADVHHVGLVTECGTVIHSSSVKGRVVETALDDTWRLLAMHRDIQCEEAESSLTEEPEDTYIETREQTQAFTSLVREEDGASILLAGRWRMAND